MERKFKSSRQKRHERIKKKIYGMAQRPRLCVCKSLSNFSAQIINDDEGRTLLSAATFDKDIRPKIKYGGNIKAAEILGKLIAEKAKEKGIKTVVFDRGGYLYHGRIKMFAEAARKNGLIF